MEEKKSKKKVIFLILLIVIIVFIAIVAGYFGYKFWESNQTVGTEWGDIYLEYLQDKKTNGEYSEAKDSTIQFVQLEENQVPAMVLSYEKDEDKFIDISIIKEDGVLKTKRVQAENGVELDLEILYDFI